VVLTSEQITFSLGEEFQSLTSLTTMTACYPYIS